MGRGRWYNHTAVQSAIARRPVTRRSRRSPRQSVSVGAPAVRQRRRPTALSANFLGEGLGTSTTGGGRGRAVRDGQVPVRIRRFRAAREEASDDDDNSTAARFDVPRWDACRRRLVVPSTKAGTGRGGRGRPSMAFRWSRTMTPRCGGGARGARLPVPRSLTGLADRDGVDAATEAVGGAAPRRRR